MDLAGLQRGLERDELEFKTALVAMFIKCSKGRYNKYIKCSKYNKYNKYSKHNKYNKYSKVYKVLKAKAEETGVC